MDSVSPHKTTHPTLLLNFVFVALEKHWLPGKINNLAQPQKIAGMASQSRKQKMLQEKPECYNKNTSMADLQLPVLVEDTKWLSMV